MGGVIVTRTPYVAGDGIAAADVNDNEKDVVDAINDGELGNDNVCDHWNHSPLTCRFYFDAAGGITAYRNVPIVAPLGGFGSAKYVGFAFSKHAAIGERRLVGIYLAGAPLVSYELGSDTPEVYGAVKGTPTPILGKTILVRYDALDASEFAIGEWLDVTVWIAHPDCATADL